MGVKRTGDLLEKLTWGFAIGLVVLSLGTHMLTGTTAGPVRSAAQQRALETRLPAAPAPAPAAPAPAGTAPAGTSTPPATSAPTTAPTTPPQPSGAGSGADRTTPEPRVRSHYN
jgi:preprotein translocase subunit SecG